MLDNMSTLISSAALRDSLVTALMDDVTDCVAKETAGIFLYSRKKKNNPKQDFWDFRIKALKTNQIQPAWVRIHREVWLL